MQKEIKNLERAIEEARKDEQTREYVGFGERILEKVREGDYEGADWTRLWFATATVKFWKGPITDTLRNYVEATNELFASLPKPEGGSVLGYLEELGPSIRGQD